MSVLPKKIIIADGLRYWYLFNAWSDNGCYVDDIVALKDNPASQLVYYFFRFLDRIRPIVDSWTAERYRVKEGEIFPKWSPSWLLAQFYILFNKYGSHLWIDSIH